MHFIQTTAEDIVELLVRPGSSRFLTPSADTQFNGGAKYNGWENFAIFE